MSCECDADGGGETQTGDVDPFCDPKDPKVITYEQIRNARKAFEGIIDKTPLEKSRLSDGTSMNLYLKKDYLQHTGSFKDRGARNVLMNLGDKKDAGVVSASGGNYGVALAYHGRELGIPITLVMPLIAPLRKRKQCEDFGAKLVIEGDNLDDSMKIAMQLAKDSGATYINGYDHPDVIAGQGTVGIEILEDLPTTNVVVVPVGGGGLLAGVAVAIKTLKPCTRIIGVETENCAGFGNSMKAGKAVSTEQSSTIADALAITTSGVNAVATAKNRVDRLIIVNEDDVAIAILRMLEHEKIVVEGAAAVCLAAVLSGQLNDFKNKNVVLLLSGSNIDATVLARCIERGLSADGRLLKISVTIADRKGSSAEMCKLIASVGSSVRRIEYQRAWLQTDVFSMRAKVVCETRDQEHAAELEKVMKEHYKDVSVIHADSPPATQMTFH